MWLAPVVIMLSNVPFSGATRYRVPADPFLILFAVVGLSVILARGRVRRRIETTPTFSLPSPSA